MSSRTLHTLTAGRGLAALAVVLFHANAILALPSYYGRVTAPLLEGGNAGVQFFFVLSGFVILLTHKRDIGVPAKVSTFAWKRFKRLYPPLWIVLLIMLGIGVFLPVIGIGLMHAPSVVAGAFLILPFGPNFLLDPEWTLRHEIVFYMVFALLIWKPRLGYIVMATWLLACALPPRVFEHLPVKVVFSSHNLLFAFGMLVCLKYQQQKQLRGTAWAAFLGGLLILATTLLTHAEGFLQEGYGYDVCLGVAAAAMILGMVHLERDGLLRVSKPLLMLGDASFAIYLIHYPVLFVAGYYGKRTALRLAPYLFIAALTAASVAIGMMFHRLVEKPMLDAMSGKRVRVEA